MVSQYVADEYGDFFIASLQNPYYNTLKVNDWEIISGLKKPNMTGVVNTSNGSLLITGVGTQFDVSFAPGDFIIIGNLTYEISEIISNTELTITTEIQLTTTSSKYYTSPDLQNNFEYEFRWSQHGGVFSEFTVLDNEIRSDKLLGLIFDTTKPLYIDVKAEVVALSSGNSLTLLSIEYTLETVDGEIVECPNFCTECEDPFAMNGCANIQVTCSTGQFNPYALTKSITMYKQLVNIVNGIFGHEVNYFQTAPDLRTTDVILMEYSLHNVVANKTIKILVPDNEFPTEAVSYDIFGIDLADFEIHITAAEFQLHFGAGTYPRNKDYMFIPIINKMYEISSVAIADEFNKSSSYWKVKLVKYQDRSDVIKGQFDEATDMLVTGIEEIFGERIQDEYAKNLKPEQFQTVVSSYRDGIRNFVNRKLRIADFDLKNRWTVVSKNYYNLTEIPLDNDAVYYNAKSEVNIDKNVAYTGWFSPQFPIASNVEYYLFGDIDADGFKLNISNTEFKLTVNDNSESFTHGITFNKNKWYAYVVNINNEYSQLSVSLYSLDLTTNMQLPQNSSNNLINEFKETRVLQSQLTWSSTSNYGLKGNSMYMTNIRVFNTPIELEQHSNVLNQYVVRDSQLAIVIDNAIPSLGFQKYVNAR